MEIFFCLIVYGILFGIASALVAKNKGRDTVAWFLGGFLLGIFGLIFVLIVPKIEPKKQAKMSTFELGKNMSIEDISLEDETKKCPMCKETIKFEAKKCRFCGHIFESGEVEREIEERKAIIMSEYQKKYSEYQIKLYCPACNTKYIEAIMENGLLGDWCPYCKESRNIIEKNIYQKEKQLSYG